MCQKRRPHRQGGVRIIRIAGTAREGKRQRRQARGQVTGHVFKSKQCSRHPVECPKTRGRQGATRTQTPRFTGGNVVLLLDERRRGAGGRAHADSQIRARRVAARFGKNCPKGTVRSGRRHHDLQKNITVSTMTAITVIVQ
jgi:hypothetical protein